VSNRSSIEDPTRSKRSQLAVAGALVALLLLAVALLWPATSGPFVFDDFPNLGNLARLDGSMDRVHLGEYLESFTGNPGRPLAALSFLIEDWDWPTDPFPFKRNNILWHLLAGVLVFALSRRLARATPTTARAQEWVALAATAMWLLHPMQLSSTMLVVQRMNLLASIFMLAGLIGYARCLGTPARSDLMRVVAAGSALGIAAVFAFLCKENGVLVFAYATALNLTILQRRIEDLAPFPRRLLLGGAAAPIIALGVLAAVNIKSIIGAYATRSFTLPERLLTEPRVLIDYIHAIFLPHLGGQGIFHDGYVVSRGLFTPWTTALCLLVLVAAVVSAWRLRRAHPWYAFGVFWFLGGHLIESTIWPLEIYFEHRNYLPMVGPLLALAAGLAATPSRMRRPAILALSGWLLLICGLTVVNARVWGDRGALSAVWLKENPGSTRAAQMRASYLADIGDLAGARRTLQQGLERNSAARELVLQMIFLDCRTNGLRPGQWSDALEVARTVHESRIVPRLIAGFGTEARGGRCKGTLPEHGFTELGEAALANPTIRRRKQSLAYIYVELSRQSVSERDLNRTMALLDASYRASPNPMVARNQAIYLLSAGLPDAAMEYLRRSESNDWPWFKRKLLDMPAMNSSLWKDARAMKAALDDRNSRL
jgi:hypothetical protein